MPKSRVRNRAVYTPPPRSSKAKVSPPWLMPAMVACLVLGLVWISLFYIVGSGLPVLGGLQGWNLAGGFTLIVAGVALATQWR